jgi:hypothetical protein
LQQARSIAEKMIAKHPNQRIGRFEHNGYQRGPARWVARELKIFLLVLTWGKAMGKNMDYELVDLIDIKELQKFMY